MTERYTRLQQPLRLDTIRQLGFDEPRPLSEFDRLARLTSALLPVPAASVTIVTDTREINLSHVGMRAPFQHSVPLVYSFAQHIVNDEEPLIIDDARQHPLVFDNPSVDERQMIAFAGYPLHAPNGEILGALCAIDHQPRQWTREALALLQDLSALVNTEIARLYHENRNVAMRDQIGFLEQMRSEMIHYAAHDLRNPLSILYGYLSLMQLDQEQLPERFAHYLELMEQAAQKMQRIIDDIQLMEDIEASADQMPTDSVDLAALLPIVMRDFEHQAHTKQIVVTLSSEADSLHVTGDLGQLQRAMGNLISNAITYTPQGGNVCIRLEGDADTVRFSIRDDGFGIAQDVQAAVWRPFYRVRTRQTMDIDGSGLGLFMVKRIIERHNGSLHMESEVGQGSVIGFSLPRLSA